jgi:quinol monooxygenase YgiN
MLCAAAALTACALAPSIGVLSVATTALGLTAVCGGRAVRPVARARCRA